MQIEELGSVVMNLSNLQGFAGLMPSTIVSNNMPLSGVVAAEAKQANSNSLVEAPEQRSSQMDNQAAFVEERLLSLMYSAARGELDGESEKADSRILANLRKTVSRTPSLLKEEHVQLLLQLCLCRSKEARLNAWELLKIRLNHRF